jgi:hypothetical protein
MQKIMKNLITLLLVFAGMTTFAQVNPSSSTQGAVTGGAAAQTKAPLAKVVGVSMKDMNRLHGSYINGHVDAQGGDEIKIVFATDLVLELDGIENNTNTSMQIQISVAPANNANPKELYLITRSGSTDEWMLKEDPFNPK